MIYQNNLQITLHNWVRQIENGWTCIKRSFIEKSDIFSCCGPWNVLLTIIIAPVTAHEYIYCIMENKLSVIQWITLAFPHLLNHYERIFVFFIVTFLFKKNCANFDVNIARNTGPQADFALLEWWANFACIQSHIWNCAHCKQVICLSHTVQLTFVSCS